MIYSLFTTPRYRLYWKISFWLVLALLLFLTLTPAPLTPLKIPHIDKVFHLLAFAGFSFVFCIAFRRINRWLIFSASCALGAIIELIQFYIPNRGASIGDFVADACGALIGLGIAIYITSKN